MRYTSKEMRAKLEFVNETLESIGHPYRLSINSSYNTNFLERGTPEQVANHGSTDSIYGACGTPRQIVYFIKCNMLGAYDQWQAGKLLEQRLNDLADAREQAWAMGFTALETASGDLRGLQSLIRRRAQEQRDQQRLQI